MSFSTGAIIGAASSVAVAVAARQLTARLVEQRVDGQFPLGRNGVRAGAESVTLESSGPPVLVLHGFGDTPQSVGELAKYLHRRGWHVRVPRLPGHGGSLRTFARSRANEWLAAAQREYAALQARGPVCLVGQSMGAALAILIAARHPETRALVLLAPYLRLPRRIERLARLGRLAEIFVPYVGTRSMLSIMDPGERGRSLGFGVTTPRLTVELQRIAAWAWDAAPSVRVPTLMLQSTLDPRISVWDAERTFERLGGDLREIDWLHDSGHVLAVDYERETVFARTARWLGQAVAPGK